MKIGLWSDSHNFPSLPLMKLSAYHKSIGDTVETLDYLTHYDLVYASKVFSFTKDIEDDCIVQADEIRRGGTGYCISVIDGKEVFDKSKDTPLPKEIEHIYPDYSIFPKYEYATGFLTRGCPRNCGFCIVGKKEGLCSRQVADLSEFWRGQKEIKLLDPNLLACKEHESILKQLAESGAKVDFTQGIDIRLTNPDNISLLNKVKTSMIHFAWDDPKQDLTECFKLFAEHTSIKSDRNKAVYVLTNFNSTIDEDLYRIYTLRDLGYSPYVMIYQKETADKTHKRLQRWVNCRWIFHSVERFEEYK
ncbi:MAG: radical SAM protein [Ruminococcus sp.]|nr:radical SAM protein [Ruminococcus sp.]